MPKFVLSFCSIIAVMVMGNIANAQDIKPTHISVKMARGLQSSSELPTADLKQARKALTRGGRLWTHQLRALADLGDGFAAYRFAQWLETQSDPKLLSDTAHYFGIAAATGRSSAFRQLIETLDNLAHDDLLPRRRDVLADIVFAYAEAGNSFAVDAAMRYHASRQPFGDIQARVNTLLANSTGEGAAQISASFALEILQKPNRSRADLKLAQQYLKIASTTSSLKTRLIASNLTPIIEDELAQSSVALHEADK